MAIRIFDRDDNEYLEWMNNNPSSFVVNTWRVNSFNYFRLHKSKCHHISTTAGLEKGAYTEKNTIKITSNNLDELNKWFKKNYSKFKGEFTECKTCNPLSKEVSANALILFPETIEDKDKILFEGAKKQVIINAYERNMKAREKCLEHYGFTCMVCNIDFRKIYGEIGQGFIHVHHLKELSDIKSAYQIDPIEDLRPVCPNCHSMLHQNKPCFTIEELRRRIKETLTAINQLN